MKLYSKVGDDRIQFQSLDDLVPSTITALIKYEGNINLMNVFLVLVTELMEDITGDFSIVFVRYLRETRGNNMKDELEEKDYFKKSVTISIVYKGNNISVKLAEEIFHICGLKSLDEAYEIVDILTQKIIECQLFVESIWRRNEETKRGARDMIKFLLSNMREKCHMKNSRINMPFVLKNATEEKKNFFERLRSYSNYMNSIDKYLNHLERIFAIEDNVITGEIKVMEVEPVMRNYIYSLGEKVNRYLLARIIKNESDKFIVKYNNSTQHFVKVKVPFTEEEMTNYKKKKRYHHFSIWRTGTISQSGRDYDKMKELFDEFTSILRRNYHLIVNMDMSFLIQYLSDDEE